MSDTYMPQNVEFSKSFTTSLLEMVDGEHIKTCIQCGTCAGICPMAYWMDFPPRKMLATLRENIFDQVIDSKGIWMCVSCYACADVCPQQIPLTLALMTRAKEESVLAGNIPTELQTALEYTQRYGNPIGESPRKRSNWAKRIEPTVNIMKTVGRPVDVLWFVGDYASYHPRVQQSTKALAKIFNALGVDFAILGPEENSDGDSQRLAGERGLFEMLAMKNDRVFGKYQFNQIVTTDPHAYNAIKNEYPNLGIEYEIKHYTQFLHERLDQLELLLTQELNAIVAYHDPCYLGRANGVYEEPRELLQAIPGVVLVEMSHNRSNSLCCGGGGGGMWLDGFHWEMARHRLSEWRVQEAVNAYPESSFSTILETIKRRSARKRTSQAIPDTRILAVACPYEVPRFEDATKVVREASKLVVKDIAELLVEAMENGR